MPQGLPKKIEVSLLFPDLALELGDPLPSRRSIIEKGTAQRRTIQPARPRPTRPPQPLQAASSSQFLPFVHTTTVDPKISRHI
jgi:hypothetical protein